MTILDDEARAVEQQYLKSTFIDEICVLAIDDAGDHRRPALYAVVVPKLPLIRQKRIANIGDLLRFELEGQSIHLPPEKRVRDYEVWFESLPRTRTGDIDRDAICRLAVARRRAQAAGSARAITRDANLEIDLGLDSMDRVALFAELERRFGVRVPDDRGHEILTVGQLMNAFELSDPGLCAPPFPEPWHALLGEAPRAGGELDVSWVLKNGGGGPATLWSVARIARAIMPRIIVTGRQQLPRNGPFILCPNHQSYLDPFFLISTLPYRLVRQMFAVGAAEYFETPLMAWLARQCKLVPVDPDANLVGAMRAAARGLRHGKILLLFPEGERSIDGAVKRFKKGAAILAQHGNVPMVPVAIRGTFGVWARNRSFHWRAVVPWSHHHVRVAFGSPMAYPEGATIADATSMLQRRVELMHDALTTATAPARTR